MTSEGQQAPVRSRGDEVSVLVVGNFFELKGNRQYCESFADRIADSGTTVIRTSRWRSRPVRLCAMLATAWRRRAGYDVAHVDVYSGRSFLWAEAVVAVLGHLGKPCVLTLHGGSLAEFAAVHPRRVRRLLSAARTVTAPSRYHKERLREYRADIEYIPNAIDIGRYRYRLREHLSPRLVWVRAFHTIYHPEMAIRVLHVIRAHAPAATLVMAGRAKDDSLRRFRSVASDLGLIDAVSILGGVPKDHVPEVLDGGDIFLNTSTIDNAPVSVIEAMASGLCVVSTDVGGMPYLLDHERTGLLVPSGDVAAMAGAVCRLLTDRDLARRVSTGAREAAEASSWERVMPAWERVFAAATGGPG